MPGSPPPPQAPMGHHLPAWVPRVTGDTTETKVVDSRAVWGLGLALVSSWPQALNHGRSEETIYAGNFQGFCSL